MAEQVSRKKHALAQVYLSRLFQMDAPMEVLTPLKEWCKQLESKLSPVGWKEDLSMVDSVRAEMISEGGKQDA